MVGIKSITRAGLATVLVAVSSCSGGSNASPSCNDGDTRACVGAGACSGGQSCSSGKWSACDCASGDGGLDAGADATSDVEPDAKPTPTKGGTIGMNTSGANGWGNDPTFQAGYNVGAAFSTPYPLDSNGYALGSCSHTVDGACEIVDCPNGLSPPTQVKYGAGTLSITGASVPLQLQSPYTSASSTEGLWSGGEVIHAVATGSDVPPFDVKLTAPSQVSVTSPPSPPYTNGIPKITFTRSSPLMVTWVNGTFGTVDIEFMGTTSTNHAVHVTCSYPAASGTATIPTSVLNAIPNTDVAYTHYTYWIVSSRALAEQVYGDWAIRFLASFRAVFSTGGRDVFIQTTFQ